MSGGFVCGGASAPADALRTLTGLAHCCLGAAEGDPGDCTCWEPVYELDQQPLNLTMHPATRPKMCDDCAYRPTSPEAQGDPNYSERPELGAGTFWCHQGMRKPVAWRHPLGITIEATGDFYEPPIRPFRGGEPVPYKADGSPGDRCAGWAAALRQDAATVGELAASVAEE